MVVHLIVLSSLYSTRYLGKTQLYWSSLKKTQTRLLNHKINQSDIDLYTSTIKFVSSVSFLFDVFDAFFFKVVRFHVGWRPSRPFPMDMAGFAVSVKLVRDNPEACFDGEAPMGFLESSFLKGLVTMDELEPKADNCTKVRVCV